MKELKHHHTARVPSSQVRTGWGEIIQECYLMESVPWGWSSPNKRETFFPRRRGARSLTYPIHTSREKASEGLYLAGRTFPSAGSGSGRSHVRIPEHVKEIPFSNSQ
ncbi:hypothetical protein CEXT_288671 [Caerostris extrusa]|uniref:Uncharacterized protein n=1 Tax=Caerostris extrusa TaxID=172846 RepID=A0AAV4QJH8_CAEEX|nr:hypothetical protein CEXT_288671 [Caerostris extrusa]